jgi:predicted ATPase
MEQALTRIDEALGLAQQTGEHWSDAYLHRIRGEILLKRDPANKAPAEEVFLTAMAIAREQKARSLELRAALSLARLYQSSNRAADAHAALAPALEGFYRPRNFPRSRKRKRFSPRWRDELQKLSSLGNLSQDSPSMSPVGPSRRAWD